MSGGTFWLGRVAMALCLLALFGLVRALLAAEDAPARVWLLTYEKSLDGQLRFLRSNMRGLRVLVLQAIVCVLCLVAALVSGNWALVLVALPCAFLPHVHLAGRLAARTTRFDEQIEGWLGAISNSLQASPSLGEAIASTIALVPAPMSEEVDVLVKEHELGTPLDIALDNLAARMGTKTIAATVVALKVARKSGGNLPEMLDSAAAALRELARLEGVVRTKTAEGRAQAWVIGAIPVPMVAGLNAIDPKFFAPLFTNFAGQFVVAVAGVLWLLAIALARKIMAVDI